MTAAGPRCACGGLLGPTHEHQDYPRWIAELVEAAALPTGYSLSVTPQRKYAHRNLWNVRVMRDGERVFGRAYYNLAVGIVTATTVAWSMSREAA